MHFSIHLRCAATGKSIRSTQLRVCVQTPRSSPPHTATWCPIPRLAPALLPAADPCQAKGVSFCFLRFLARGSSYLIYLIPCALTPPPNILEQTKSPQKYVLERTNGTKTYFGANEKVQYSDDQTHGLDIKSGSHTAKK